MYSFEKRLKTVELYFELGNNAALTVRRLGYPDVTSLVHWVDEYKRNQSLHAQKYRYSKYSDGEKERAIQYYMKDGKNILQTVKVLGYPSRPLLKSWIKEYNPVETERRCQTFKPHVRCTGEQQLQAVRESCRGDLTISEIAAIYNVTLSAVSIWRRKLLGERRNQVIQKPPNEDKDTIQLKKEKLELEAEVEALRKEACRLQLENDVLKKAAGLLKKDKGISLEKLTNRDKAIVIDALRNRYLLKDLLLILNMAKSSYCYQESSLRRPDKYAELRIDIRSAFEESSQRYGYRRLHMVLISDGFILSEKILRRIMQEEGLVVYQKHRRKYSSYKGEISPEVENLLKRDFYAEKPNTKWLTDITEFAIPVGKVYLSPIIDCFDGTVTSWTVGVSPDAALVNQMLDKAVELLREDEYPIMHSDRGCHYRWPGWIERPESAGLIRSMSKKGCSPDNSACEGFFGRLKNEMFYCHSWEDTTIEVFIEEVNQYIRWYNEKRIKMSLGGMSPLNYRKSLELVA